MRSVAALFLLSFAALAQTPPAEVDAALRQRVNEFYGYHVTGDFEKAWSMVADDTKKEYFSAQKTKYEKFSIDSIKYNDDFTKAVVTLTVSEKKRVNVQFPEVEMTHPSTVTWKIENGKWCWYNDHATNWITPMGPSDTNAQAKGNNSGAPNLSPERIKQLAQGIVGQSAFDKTDVTLTVGKPATEQAVFKNGQGGPVRLTLVPVALPPGLTASLSKTDLNADEQAVLKIAYKPVKDAPPPPTSVTLTVAMDPFNRMFAITVHLKPAE